MVTRFRQTQIDLLVTTFAGEAWRTRTTEVVDQIGTVRAQQTWIFRAIVDIHFAQLTSPARQTIAFEATLLQGQTRSAVRTGITVCRARVNGDVAIVASVAAATQTRVVSMARFILAHGARRACILQTGALFFLTILAGVAGRALAAIALR